MKQFKQHLDVDIQLKAARQLQVFRRSGLHRLKIQDWDTHLFQDLGPLLTLLQQMFGVTCSFIENGLSREEERLNASLCFTLKLHS